MLKVGISSAFVGWFEEGLKRSAPEKCLNLWVFETPFAASKILVPWRKGFEVARDRAANTVVLGVGAFTVQLSVRDPSDKIMSSIGPLHRR